MTQLLCVAEDPADAANLEDLLDRLGYAARFFADAPTLAGLVRTPDPDPERGAKLLAIARRRYTWARIGRRYFDLFRAVTRGSAAAPQD